MHPVNMKANSRAMTLIRLIPVNKLAMEFPFPPDGDRRAGPIRKSALSHLALGEGYHGIRTERSSKLKFNESCPVF